MGKLGKLEDIEEDCGEIIMSDKIGYQYMSKIFTKDGKTIRKNVNKLIISLFTKDVLRDLCIEINEIFSREDKNEKYSIFEMNSDKENLKEDLYCWFASTYGFHQALNKVLKKHDKISEFNTFYDTLDWWDGDYFDSIVEDMLQDYFIHSDLFKEIKYA